MAKDMFHDAVVIALQKEGWQVTHDPFSFRVGKVDFHIDLGAEHLVGAVKGSEKIAVEIKTFLELSPTYAFHTATGQYDNYLLALEEYEPDRVLYLAIPERIYDTFFQRPFVQKVVSRKNIRLIIYQPIEEHIIKWIN